MEIADSKQSKPVTIENKKRKEPSTKIEKTKTLSKKSKRDKTCGDTEWHEKRMKERLMKIINYETKSAPTTSELPMTLKSIVLFFKVSVDGFGLPTMMPGLSCYDVIYPDGHIRHYEYPDVNKYFLFEYKGITSMAISLQSTKYDLYMICPYNDVWIKRLQAGFARFEFTPNLQFQLVPGYVSMRNPVSGKRSRLNSLIHDSRSDLEHRTIHHIDKNTLNYLDENIMLASRSKQSEEQHKVFMHEPDEVDKDLPRGVAHMIKPFAYVLNVKNYLHRLFLYQPYDAEDRIRAKTECIKELNIAKEATKNGTVVTIPIDHRQRKSLDPFDADLIKGVGYQPPRCCYEVRLRGCAKKWFYHTRGDEDDRLRAKNDAIAYAKANYDKQPIVKRKKRNVVDDVDKDLQILGKIYHSPAHCSYFVQELGHISKEFTYKSDDLDDRLRAKSFALQYYNECIKGSASVTTTTLVVDDPTH